MELSFSPSRMPKFNYVSGDLALEQTSIWSEAISGKSRLSNEEAKAYEQKKNEYIKELTRAKTKEEIDGQKGRTVCSRCGKAGHMAFQCFNFLNNGLNDNPSLNELISSESESESEDIKVDEKERSRSRSRHHRHHRHHHHNHKSYFVFHLFSYVEINQRILLHIIQEDHIVVITVITRNFIFLYCLL